VSTSVSTGACLEPEYLAALVDRRVAAPGERRAMLAHIASCDDCYVAFAGTARVMDVDSRGPEVHPEQPIIPGHGARGRARGPWLLAAAAGILLATGLFCWHLNSRPTGADGAPLPAPVARGAHPSTQPLPAATPPPSGSPLPPSRNPRATGSAAAWIQDAPWATAGRARYGFAAEPATKRALLLGMHLGALSRACRGNGETPDTAAVREVGQSLQRTGLVEAAERVRLLAHAAAHDCTFTSPGGHAAWLDLGRELEQWRIAVVEKDPSAFDAARGRRVGALVESLPLEGPVLDRATRLIARVRAGEDRSWESLTEDLDELIELLCA
jgi:hypothetical protein